MSDYEYVRVERDGAVGRLVMDRPETNNSMDLRMAEEMRRGAIELVEDDDLRCLVLTGTGATFNTGADLTAVDGDASDGATLRRVAGDLHECVGQLARAPKPVVTGVNGVAAGGGVGPALCGDVVIVSGSARFEFAYPRIGLSVDGGSSYFLPRLVGLRRAQEIAFRDEPITADEAVDLGLATEAVPDPEFGEALTTEAERLATGPTMAYAETRRLLRESFDRQLDEQMAEEADRLAALTATDDYARGIEAFLNKEEPTFEGE